MCNGNGFLNRIEVGGQSLQAQSKFVFHSSLRPRPLFAWFMCSSQYRLDGSIDGDRIGRAIDWWIVWTRSPSTCPLAVFIIGSSGFLTSCFVFYKFSTGLNLLAVINDLSQSFWSVVLIPAKWLLIVSPSHSLDPRDSSDPKVWDVSSDLASISDWP